MDESFFLDSEKPFFLDFQRVRRILFLSGYIDGMTIEVREAHASQVLEMEMEFCHTRT